MPHPDRDHPDTGVDLEPVSRINPPQEDGPAPSTKTDPPTPPGTMAPVAREDPTRETSAPSNATAESTFEDDCAELASPSKPGAPKAPAKAERGAQTKQEISPPPTEISLPVQGQEKSWRRRYRWSYRGNLHSARVRELTSHLSLSRGSDKARVDPERSFWPQPPRRPEPTSRPGA